MSEQNVAVEVAEVVETVEKPKRKRTAPAKVKKTGQEIVNEITELTSAVAELEYAVESLDQDTVIFKLADKELKAKQNELADALDTVYTYI